MIYNAEKGWLVIVSRGEGMGTARGASLQAALREAIGSLGKEAAGA